MLRTAKLQRHWSASWQHGVRSDPVLTPPPSPNPVLRRHHELKVVDGVVDDPDIPGPGFYGDPDPEPMGRSGPAYTFRPRHRDLKPDQAPGPGARAGSMGSMMGCSASCSHRVRDMLRRHSHCICKRKATTPQPMPPWP